MKSLFCYIGLHNWKYKKEKHSVTGHPVGRDTVRVLVRDCSVCGHREHHMLPRPNGKLNKWVNYDHISKDATIKFTEL